MRPDPHIHLLPLLPLPINPTCMPADTPGSASNRQVTDDRPVRVAVCHPQQAEYWGRMPHLVTSEQGSVFLDFHILLFSRCSCLAWDAKLCPTLFLFMTICINTSYCSDWGMNQPNLLISYPSSLP